MTYVPRSERHRRARALGRELQTKMRAAKPKRRAWCAEHGHDHGPVLRDRGNAVPYRVCERCGDAEELPRLAGPEEGDEALYCAACGALRDARGCPELCDADPYATEVA